MSETADFVALEGFYTEAGPVIGAVVDQAGGPLLVLDLDGGLVRPIRDTEKLQTPPGYRAPEQEARTDYVLVSSNGQPGRASYDSPILAALVARPGVQIAARQAEKLRALSPQEREQVTEFLTANGLGDRLGAV